jgi:sodium-dependent phosphate transporter
VVDDVANAWAAPVSGRSILYKKAMICAVFFETLGAVTLGGRNAQTIKNSIVDPSAWQDNTGVFMLAFVCALFAAVLWGIWCTRHSLHVSSTYSLSSAVAEAGGAAGGFENVHWGWYGGKGIGAIFSGMLMVNSIPSHLQLSNYSGFWKLTDICRLLSLLQWWR